MNVLVFFYLSVLSSLITSESVWMVFKGYRNIRHSNTVALRHHDVILRHIASLRLVASLKENIVGNLDVVT